MASILDQIPKQIYQGFRGKLRSGTLRRHSNDPLLALDENGETATPLIETWSCQGFVDNYSKFLRAQAGIPDSDMQINIFASSLTSGVVPKIQDYVTFAGGWYQLKVPQTDPAVALWTCQGTITRAPSDVGRLVSG